MQRAINDPATNCARYPALVSRPDVLYHGSRVLVSVLEPRNGGVNAAHDRFVALPFALTFVPDERGRCKWTLHTHPDGGRIALDHGSLDTTRTGYLYRVPADRFEQVNRSVWVCHEPVTPLDHEVVRGADYASWVVAR